MAELESQAGSGQPKDVMAAGEAPRPMDDRSEVVLSFLGLTEDLFDDLDWRVLFSLTLTARAWKKTFGPSLGSLRRRLEAAVARGNAACDGTATILILNSLRTKDLQEVLAFARPPQDVCEVIGAAVFLSRDPKTKTSFPASDVSDWPKVRDEVRARGGAGTFLESLKAVDLFHITDAQMDSIQRLRREEWFDATHMQSRSFVAGKLVRWCAALVSQWGVFRANRPMWEQHRRLQKRLADVIRRMHYVETHPHRCPRTLKRFATASAFAAHKARLRRREAQARPASAKHLPGSASSESTPSQGPTAAPGLRPASARARSRHATAPLAQPRWRF